MSRRPTSPRQQQPSPSGWAPQPVAAVAALVLGLIAGAGSGLAVAAYQDDEISQEAGTVPGFPARDRVRDAVAELRADGVHVAPDGRAMLDAAGERQVEVAVAAADRVPVHVIVWAQSRDIGDDEITVDAQVEAALSEERSVIIVWQGPQKGRVLTTDGYAYTGIFAQDFVGDPATTLPGLIETAQQTEWSEQQSSAGGPIAAGIGLGTMIGLITSGTVLVGTWLVRRRRNR